MKLLHRRKVKKRLSGKEDASFCQIENGRKEEKDGKIRKVVKLIGKFETLSSRLLKLRLSECSFTRDRFARLFQLFEKYRRLAEIR